MSQHIHYTACPVVAQSKKKFWVYSDVAGDGQSEFISFERDIIWIRESETVCVMTHGGEDINNLQTLSDYNGFLDSFKASLKDTPRDLISYNIKPESSLRLELRVNIWDRPYLIDRSENGLAENARGKGWKKAVKDTPHSWFIDNSAIQKLIKDKKDQKAWERLECLTDIPVWDKRICWESHWSSDEKARGVAFILEAENEAKEMAKLVGNVFGEVNLDV